jgi:hypothetical protein
VSLKIEEVSNETSNLMIEDRQNASAATRWRFDLFSLELYKLIYPISSHK